MALTVTLGGVNYSIPEVGDSNWAANLSLYLQTVATAFPQVGTGSTGWGVYAEYTNSVALSIPNTTVTTINYGNLVTDTDSAVSTGASWKFTCPAGKSGRYLVSATFEFATTGMLAATTAFEMYLYKNNALLAAGPALVIAQVVTQGQGLAYCTHANLTAGDFIDMRVFQNNGGARNSTSTATDNRITISRIP